MSVILETKQLCKFYGAGENQVKAVNQVDIQIERGEFVAIVGKSGSGKSTLLHMLGGLDTPTKGNVTLAGKDLYRMKEDALAVFRTVIRDGVFKVIAKLIATFIKAITQIRAEDFALGIRTEQCFGQNRGAQ